MTKVNNSSCNCPALELLTFYCPSKRHLNAVCPVWVLCICSIWTELRGLRGVTNYLYAESLLTDGRLFVRFGSRGNNLGLEATGPGEPLGSFYGGDGLGPCSDAFLSVICAATYPHTFIQFYHQDVTVHSVHRVGSSKLCDNPWRGLPGPRSSGLQSMSLGRGQCLLYWVKRKLGYQHGYVKTV